MSFLLPLTTSHNESTHSSHLLSAAGDVVVHVFLPATRSFYALEEFYGNAVPIELPFPQVNMEW